MNNEPAFPVRTAPCTKEDGPGKAGYIFGHQDSNYTWQYSGMTLRDYFAGQAVIGIVSNKHLVSKFVDDIASDAYKVADAMLKKRDAQ